MITGVRAIRLVAGNAAWYTIWQWMPISVLPQADPGNLPGRRPLAPLHLLYFLRGRILGVAASPYSHAYMGLDTKATQFLLTARGSGVSFERIATIGRQRLCVTPAWLRARLHAAGIDRDTAATARLFKEADGYAEPLLRALGAARIISLDASSYEGASRVADLNAEIAPDLENAFTTVLDSGSLEPGGELHGEKHTSDTKRQVLTGPRGNSPTRPLTAGGGGMAPPAPWWPRVGEPGGLSLAN